MSPTSPFFAASERSDPERPFSRRYEEEGSEERREVPAEYTEVPLGVGDLLVIDPMLMHSASTNAGEVSAPLSPSDFLISPKEPSSSLASRALLGLLCA